MPALRSVRLESAAQNSNHIKVCNEENDTIVIANKSFTRCSLENLGLKHAVISNTRIKYSALSYCYLRNADLRNVDFTGTRFVGCDLGRAKLQLCNFRYCTLMNCRIDLDEFLPNLPQEPNLRKQLLAELRCNQLSIGDKHGADRLLLLEIDAERMLWREELLLRTSYYRDRARPWGRLRAAGRLLKSWFLAAVWGHGLRIGNILASATAVVIAFALLLYGTGQLSTTGRDGYQEICLLQAVFLSVSSFTTLGFSDILPLFMPMRILLCAEGFLGAVFIAMLGAALYRKIAR